MREHRTKMSENSQSDFMKCMDTLVGGRWVGQQQDDQGKPQIEWRYEWSPDHMVLRGTGRIFGAHCESRIGWDARVGKAFYLDLHGPTTVYFGHMELVGNEVLSEFSAIVGTPGEYASRGRFEAPDVYCATIRSLAEGSGQEAMHIRLTRVE